MKCHPLLQSPPLTYPWICAPSWHGPRSPGSPRGASPGPIRAPGCFWRRCAAPPSSRFSRRRVRSAPSRPCCRIEPKVDRQIFVARDQIHVAAGPVVRKYSKCWIRMDFSKRKTSSEARFEQTLLLHRPPFDKIEIDIPLENAFDRTVELSNLWNIAETTEKRGFLVSRYLRRMLW